MTKKVAKVYKCGQTALIYSVVTIYLGPWPRIINYVYK